MRRIYLGLAAALAVESATLPAGDARRGEQLFRSERCVQCHSIAGRGGRTAPDLSKRIDREYTPASMAATMWNHAPSMWAAMQQQGIVKATLSEESAADLFAYFFSTRFFERPGDAGRGKAAFAAKHCAECHGITEAKASGVKPVAQWQSLGDPVILVHEMWNHATAMRDAFAKRRLAAPQLSAQELTDILVYLQNLPQTRHLAAEFSFPPVESGESLFRAKGCATCHTGRLALENRLRNTTLTEISAAMWNHAGKMLQLPPPMDQEEMRQIVGYVWTQQFFNSRGNAGRGKAVFAAKNCAQCHGQAGSGAPPLAGKEFSEIVMVSALWEHGPRILERMRERKLSWPRFSAGEMADLVAYLNSL